jgi:hypothetical protein
MTEDQKNELANIHREVLAKSGVKATPTEIARAVAFEYAFGKTFGMSFNEMAANTSETGGAMPAQQRPLVSASATCS